jgi:hypothetical protein
MYANRSVRFHVLTYNEYYKHTISYRLYNSTTRNIRRFKIMRGIRLSLFFFLSSAKKN